MTVKEIVNAYLAGLTTPAKVAKEVIGLKPGTDEFVQATKEIRKILDDPAFKRQVQRARADVVTSVKESYRKEVFKYKHEMDKLAFESSDPRVRFQALKDGLDRADTAPTQKKSLYFSPQDYVNKLNEQGLLGETEDDDKEEDGAPVLGEDA